MNLSADDILASPIWAETTEAIEAQLWAEFNSAPLGDGEALTQIHARRWAVRRIVAELEGRMRDPRSPNTEGRE